MSIIINALKKAGPDRNNKGLDVKSFFITIRDKNNSFIVGLIAGFVLMFTVSSVLFVYLLLSANSKKVENQPEQISTPVIEQKLQSVNKKMNQLDTIPDLDVLPEQSAETLGPDVEDDILEDELILPQRAESKPKIKPDELEFNQNIPVVEYEINPSDIMLPDFVISGVVSDMEGKYVYIDGVPYSEGESNGIFSIKKISFLSIVVIYKSNEIEIALK